MPPRSRQGMRLSAFAQVIDQYGIPTDGGREAGRSSSEFCTMWECFLTAPFHTKTRIAEIGLRAFRNVYSSNSI